MLRYFGQLLLSPLMWALGVYMSEIPSMQSVVASICRAVELEGKIIIEQLHGTGFFINEDGFFLTAKHVIQKGLIDVGENGGFLVFCPYFNDSIGFVVVKIEDYEFASNAYDIAICKSNLKSQTFYKFKDMTVGPWKDIATHGYPASIVHKNIDEFQIQTRFHKGYIQREVPKGRMHDGKNPPLFELSFPITQGLSGSPLFIHAQPNDFLIGVCVGTTQSQLVLYEETDIEEDGSKYQERTVKVEEFGIAHDIRGLANWKPNILNGASLSETMK
jgi:hypothetical protein